MRIEKSTMLLEIISILWMRKLKSMKILMKNHRCPYIYSSNVWNCLGCCLQAAALHIWRMEIKLLFIIEFVGHVHVNWSIINLLGFVNDYSLILENK